MLSLVLSLQILRMQLHRAFKPKGRTKPRNLSHVPQRLAFVAILAVSGVLIGSDSEAVYAGCFPEANRTVDVTTSNAEEHTDDTAVNGTAGNQTGVPNSAWADWGSARLV